MNKEVVLPCPHCGNESEIVKYSHINDYYPRCLTPDCINELGSGRTYSTEGEAIAAWNMRPSPSNTAIEAAKNTIVTIQESHGIEYKAGEPIDDIEWRLWASTLDAFAAQREKARQEEIVGELYTMMEQYSDNPTFPTMLLGFAAGYTDKIITVVRQGGG